MGEKRSYLRVSLGGPISTPRSRTVLYLETCAFANALTRSVSRRVENTLRGFLHTRRRKIVFDGIDRLLRHPLQNARPQASLQRSARHSLHEPPLHTPQHSHPDRTIDQATWHGSNVPLAHDLAGCPALERRHSASHPSKDQRGATTRISTQPRQRLFVFLITSSTVLFVLRA